MQNFKNMCYIRNDVLLASAAFVVYINCLQCGFVFDDVSAIKENQDLRSSTSWINLFKNDFWGTPMNQVTGVVGRAELLSSLIFLICLLIYLKLLSDHNSPHHYLPKTIIVGFLMSLGTLCKEQCITLFGVLFAYEFILCYQYFLSTSKCSQPNENCSTKSRSKRNIKCTNAKEDSSYVIIFTHTILKMLTSSVSCRIIVLLAFTMCTMYLRIQVMHGQLPHFTEFDNPAAHAVPLIRRLTHLYLVPVNLGLLLCPSFLCADWTLGSLRLIDGWTDPRNLLTLVAFSGLILTGLIALHRNTSANQSRVLVMSLSLMAFPFLPASNLFFPVGFVVAERVLYMPSLGFCLLVGLGYQQLCGSFWTVSNHTVLNSNVIQNHKRSRKQKNPKWKLFFCRIMVSLIILAFSLKTIRRNIDWKNEYNLFSSALKVNPNNAKMWNNVGHALEAESKFSEALGYFRKAVDVQPNDMGARINVGRTYVNLGMPKEAELAYMEALEYFPKPKKGKTYFTRVAPKDLMIFINLANLYLNKTPPQLDDAAQLLRRAISLRSDFIEAYQNYGSVLIKLGRVDEAQEIYKTALAHQPHNADLNYNLGVVLLDAGNKKEGLGYLEKALLYSPGHQPSLFALASTLGESDQLEERLKAKSLYEYLVEQKYELVKVYFALGMLETDENNYEKAADHYKEVTRLDPTHRSALFNIALLYRNQLSKIEEAAEALQVIIRSHPTHVKSYLLMGDIALTERKDFQMAQKAVALAPDNLQAKHNLCVTLAESGQWKASEDCLVEAIQQFPDSPPYLAEHLSVVRSRLKSMDKKNSNNNP